MYFEYPKLLWLMIVPALLVLHYIWLELAREHPHMRVSTVVPWTIKPSYGMAILRHMPFVLRTFALVMIVVAIARPRSSEQMEKIDTEGYDWLYKQLNINVNKPEKKQVVSLGSCAVSKKAK